MRKLSLFVAASCIFCAGLVHAVSAPLPAEPIVLTCKTADITQNLTIDLAAKNITMETIMPNPGGSPDPVVSDASFPDPSGQKAFSMQVTDRAVTWSIDSHESIAPGPTLYALDRFTGMLQQTRQPGGVYPQGQHLLWTCQKRQRVF